MRPPIWNQQFRARTIRRDGMALYITVMSISVLVVGTGLTLIAIQRSERRLQDNIVRIEQVQWCARSGIEQALLYMEQVSDWRSRVVSNKLLDELPVGDGLVTVEVFDDADGNLSNNNAQPVRLVSTATLRGAKSKLSAQLTARPHEAMKCAVFGSGTHDMEFKNTVQVRGPVRSHGKIKAAGTNTVTDDASFETMTGYTIDSVFTPTSFALAAIAAPAPDLSFYTALGTNISGDYGGVCDVKGYNLTPTHNPVGTANANGIYVLRAGNRAVNIENLHVKGTLIITDTNGNLVTFDEGCWLEPGPLNYPVLMIDTTGNVTFDPDSTSFAEASTWLTIPLLGVNVSTLGVDFNENGLIVNTIATQVRGVIWTNCAHLTVGGGSYSCIGSIIAPRITIEDAVSIDNDLTQLYNPIPGFVQSGMKLIQGSFREIP